MTDETVYRVSLLVPVQIEERAGSPEEAQAKAIGRHLWLNEDPNGVYGELYAALRGVLLSENDTHRESDDRWSVFRYAAHNVLDKARPKSLPPEEHRPVTVCIGMPEVKTVIEAITATDAAKQ